MKASNRKGWTFRFLVYSGLGPDEDKEVRVVVVGEVGNVNHNAWDGSEDALFYMDEDSARSIALDTVRDKFDANETGRVQWIDTSTYNRDHLVGLKMVDAGVWI